MTVTDLVHHVGQDSQTVAPLLELFGRGQDAAPGRRRIEGRALVPNHHRQLPVRPLHHERDGSGIPVGVRVLVHVVQDLDDRDPDARRLRTAGVETQAGLEDALKELKEVFALEPLHVDAKLAEGRINLKLMRLEVATDIELGDVQKQRIVVPGKVLKVRVEDKLRRIVKRTSSIEM